jgi:hypothetical protein
VELYDLYSLQNLIGEIKLRLFKWAGHMAYVGGEVHTGFGRQLKEKDCLKNLRMNGRIILKLILNK